MRNDRRTFLSTSVLAIGVAALGPASVAASEGDFEIMKSEAEWRRILTPSQFQVLRKEKTERAFSSPLDREKRAGTYHCAGCDLPVYSSEHKYESGTGWPSFWRPLTDSSIGTRADFRFFMRRTEVHCARCGGHLGHVFNDGPKPTGKRYCMNGVALTFRPA